LERKPLARWAPAGLAAVAFVGVLGWSLVDRGDGSSNGDAAADSDTTPFVADPAAATPSTAAPSTAPRPKVPLTRTLSQGLAGADVQLVQERLVELGFDPGVIDGIYGPATIQAVWAFEKIVMGTPREQVSGEVTPAVWERMQDPIVIAPRRTDTSATHLEVYLPQQVAVLFVDGKTRIATHISSGTGKEWCEEVTIDPGERGNEKGTEPLKKGVCGVGVTPGGVYTFDRRVDGWREGSLGRMFSPVYFNYGIAVHGSGNVPNYPASHGCVRIPMHIAEYFPSLVSRGDQVFVFDGVEDPEAYGAQLPVFDYPDPSYVTSTTTTTTTTTTTVPRPTPAPTPAPTPPRPPAPTPAPTAATAAPTTASAGGTLASP
jgi:peptidoglycan hydrolase-like protein with peptidoglycan-binding domain